MPSMDLIARFIGVDVSQGATYDRMYAKSSKAADGWQKLVLGAGIAGGLLVAYSIKSAAQYQMLTENLVTGAGEQQSALKMVSNGMLGMAGQVGDSATELAKAMFIVESAGYHGAAGLTILKTAAEGAKVDNADLTTVVDALTSAMNAYHEPASAAAKVTNTLIASAAVGKMHLQDLTASLGSVLPTAAALHVPLDQVGAAMANMTAQGTNAARAATYLRFMFSALANPTTKAQGAMQAVGLTSQQVATTMTHGGLPAVLLELETAVGKKFPAGSAQYLAALANMVGGTRGLQAVLENTGVHLVTLDGRLTSIQDRVKSAGNNVSDWSDIQKNFNQQLAEFADGLQADAIRLGTDLLPVVTTLLHVLSAGGHVIGDTAGFFEHNEIAAGALAVVLASRLGPAVLATAAEFAGVAATGAVSVFTLISREVMGTVVAFEAAGGGVAGFGAALESLNINPVIAALSAVTIAGLALDHMFNEQSKAAIAAGRATGQAYVHGLDDMHYSLQTTTADTAKLKTQIGLAFAHHSSLSQLAGQISALAPAQQASAAAAKTMATNEAALQAQFHISATTVQALAKSYGIQLNGAYQSVASSIENALNPTQLLAQADDTLAKSASGSADAVQSLTTKLATLIGGPLAEAQAATQFASDLDAMTATAKKNTGAMTNATAAGRANRTMLQGLTGDISSSLTNWEKAGDSTQTMATKLGHLESALRTNAIATIGNKSAVDAYLRSVHLLPSQIDQVLGVLKGKGESYGELLDEGLEQGMLARIPQVSGAARQVLLASLNAMHKSGAFGSPSKITDQYGKWLAEGLINGWRGESAKLKDALSTGLQDALAGLQTSLNNDLTKMEDRLKASQQTLTAFERARKQAIGSLKASISGTVDMGSLFGTDANGNPTVGNLGSLLSGSVGPIMTEAKDLRLLQGKHLSEALLRQISGLPPSQAVQVMQQILSGQDGSIASLDRNEDLIQHYANQAAKTVIDSPAEKRQLAVDRQQVELNKEMVAETKKTNKFLERMVARTVAQHITMTVQSDGTLKFSTSQTEDLVKAINKLASDKGVFVKTSVKGK